MSEPVKQNASAAVDADYSLEAVPESARKGFWQMFFVMLGFTFFLPYRRRYPVGVLRRAGLYRF